MVNERASRNARFFDRFVCRVGGAPLEVLDGLRGQASRPILVHILELEKQLADAAEPLADSLHQLGDGPAPLVR